MVEIRISLSKEENEILETFTYLNNEENKVNGLKSLIMRYKELDKAICEGLKLRKRGDK